MAFEEYYDQLWRAVDRYLAAAAFGTSTIYLHDQEETIYHQAHALQLASSNDNILRALEQVEHFQDRSLQISSRIRCTAAISGPLERTWQN